MGGGWLAVVCPEHRSGQGGSMYLVTEEELACFDHFCRHLFTNPVSIWAFLSRMAFCEPGQVNGVSLAEFWLIFRRSPFDNYLGVSLQNGILWARPGKSSVLGWILTDFQAFGSWYPSEFARRWPLRFGLSTGTDPSSVISIFSLLRG